MVDPDACKYDAESARKVDLALEAAKETADQVKTATNKLISDLDDAVKGNASRINASELAVGVLEKALDDLRDNTVDRFVASREAVTLALAAAKDTTAIAQSTADKAVAKAEAAADKAYLESQVEGLRNSFTAQIVAQKEATNAALVAAKDALTAALAAAEKAIAKAEESTNKRFESVNEFRKTLSDQTSSFIPRNEYQVQDKAIAERLASLEKSRSEEFGKGKGVASLGALVAGAVAVVASIIAIVVALSRTAIIH